MAREEENRGLVQCSTAVLCATQARNLVLLQWEFVVVGDFFIDGDGLLRVDHDLLLGLDGDNLGITVWLQKRREMGEQQCPESESDNSCVGIDAVFSQCSSG